MPQSGEVSAWVRRVLVWTNVLDELAEDEARVRSSRLYLSNAFADQANIWMTEAHRALSHAQNQLKKNQARIIKVEPDGLGGMRCEWAHQGYIHQSNLRAEWFRTACQKAMQTILNGIEKRN